MAKRTKSISGNRDVEAVVQRVAKKIKPASELDYHFRGLIYGRTGVGKTRVACSSPKPLLIDVNDKGTDSVRRDLNPNTFLVEYWQEVNDVYWYLQSADHDYETVIVDGVTAMQTLCMKFVLGDEAARDASRDPDMPSRIIWNKVGELMKTQITNFRNLPMNVIFTAQRRVVEIGEDEDDVQVITRPNCSPSVWGHLEAAVGLIGYLYKREVVVKVPSKKDPDKRVRVKRTRRFMVVDNDQRYECKERYGLFGNVIEAPDLSKMIATWKGA